MLRESLGAEYFSADRRFKDALAQALVSNYSRLGPAEQASMAQIPAVWAVLQAGWPSIPEAEKQKFRDQWRASLQGLAKNTSQSAAQAPAQNQGSFDQQLNHEVQSSWVRGMSQNYMTSTINTLMRVQMH